jgi:hypothetical protein
LTDDHNKNWKKKTDDDPMQEFHTLQRQTDGGQIDNRDEHEPIPPHKKIEWNMPPKSILYPLIDINDVYMLERACNTDPCQNDEEKTGKISIKGIFSDHTGKHSMEILSHDKTYRN